jgi:Tol biopolymer transport system component
VVVKSDQIEADLERICGSAEFAASPRLVRLLRFCVEQSRLNRLDNLKESTIGVAVFDREPSYDLKSDPIVRVTAARLRRKLDEFYRSRDDYSTVIEIPKGSYVAFFHTGMARQLRLPEPEAESEAISPPAKAPARAEVRTPWLRTALVVVPVALLAVGLWLRARQASRSPSVAAVEPLVALPGLATDPAWSPDGETLAFAWNGGTPQPLHIYTLKRGASVPVRLTLADRSEYRPAWSPDGRRIALLRQTSRDESSLVITEVSRDRNASSRTERVVRTIAQPDFAMNMTALDWSPNGKWLVSSEGSNGGGSRHLVLISADDGSAQAITDPPIAVTGDVEARFSPDSQKIAFRRGGEGTLFVLSLGGNDKWQPVQLTELNSGVRGIAWSRDGEKIYFGSQQSQGYFSLWSVFASGGKPTLMTSGIEALSPAVHPRENVIVVSQQQIDQNLWLYSLDGERQPHILVPSTAVESAPTFSPDGRGFAFVSSRSGSLEVWVSGIDDLMPRRVTSLGDAKVIGNLSWTPDGLSIVYAARRKGRNGAWLTNIGNGVTAALRQSDTYSNWPQFSADGSSLYFVSNAEHVFRLWRQTGRQMETAAPLVPELIVSFRMPDDRRSIYFLRSGTQTVLLRMDPVTKNTVRVYSFPQNGLEISAWDIVAGRLFYVALDASRCKAVIMAVELDGASKTLGEFPVPSVEHWQPAISASPDGQSVIVARTDRDDATLLSVHLR